QAHPPPRRPHRQRRQPTPTSSTNAALNRLNLLQHVRQVEVLTSVSPFETLERGQHLVTTGHGPTSPEPSAAALMATAQSIRTGQTSSRSSDDTATPFAPSR